MARHRRRADSAGGNAGGSVRRVAFMILCAAGLAGLISCQSSQRKTAEPGKATQIAKTTDSGAVALPTNDATAKAQLTEPAIRVAVLKDAPTARITGGKARRVLNAAGRVVLQPADEAVLDIVPASGGVTLSGVAGVESAFLIESASADDLLRVNNQELSRVVRVNCSPKSAALNVVAHLEMETYLAGVLAGEVPFEKWHPEALKAQAITSRSYAFYQTKKNANEAYDVESTVMSQVFKPGYRSNPILSAAISATRGLVLTYNGAVFSAYFHSTCGGHTDVGSSVFPDQAPIKPLSGVPCMFCQQSPSFRWKTALDKAALERKLFPATATPPHIQSVTFLDAAGGPLPPLGRAVQVVVKHERGDTKFQGNQFRLLVGPRDLKSLLLERVTDMGTTLDIQGGGYGHGVGLCQWGSQGMGQAGYGFAQILGKYFPGAALTRMY